MSTTSSVTPTAIPKGESGPAKKTVTGYPMQSTRGGLRDGFPGGNPHLAPRCGARTRAGTPCGSPSMKNGKCRMHGGASTGARTQEGKSAHKQAVTKHGYRGELGRALGDVRRLLTSRARQLAARQ